MAREPFRGGLTDRDRARHGKGLEPRRDVRRVAEADRLTFGAPDGADGHLAAVEPDAHVEVGDTPGDLDLTRVLADDMNDLERRPRGALGIVFMDYGEAEEGGYSIAHECVDAATELLDRSGHAADALADQSFDLLRRQKLSDGCRSHEVGEQGRHRSELVPVDRSVGRRLVCRR